jgi:hypothetical protein
MGPFGVANMRHRGQTPPDADGPRTRGEKRARPGTYARADRLGAEVSASIAYNVSGEPVFRPYFFAPI